MTRRAWPTIGLTSALAACVVYPPPDRNTLYACDADGGCPSGFFCGDQPVKNVCLPMGADAGGDAGPEAGADAGADAGLTFQDAGAGLVQLQIVALAGGPVTSITPVSGSTSLVLGDSLWVTDGGMWNEVTGGLYHAVEDPAPGGAAFQILQVLVTPTTWFAEVYDPAQGGPAAYTFYATSNGGGSWTKGASLGAAGLAAAYDDPQAGSILVAVDQSPGSPTTLELFNFDGGPLGSVRPPGSTGPPDAGWTCITSLQPYAYGAGMLVGHGAASPEIDLVRLDAGVDGGGGLVSQTYLPLNMIASHLRQSGGCAQVGPLLDVLYQPPAGGPVDEIFFPFVGSSGDELWSGSPLISSSGPAWVGFFYQDAGSFSFVQQADKDGGLWFGDGERLLFLPDAGTTPQHLTAESPPLLLGAVGSSIWGVEDRGLRDESPLVSNGGGQIDSGFANQGFYGQNLRLFRAANGTLLAFGGSNPTAPILYQDTGNGFREFTPRSYPGCRAYTPIDPADVLLSCTAGLFLAQADGGVTEVFAGASGDVTFLPPAATPDGGSLLGAGPLTFYLAGGDGTGAVSTFTLDLGHLSAVSAATPLPAIVGPVSASHPGDQTPAAYAFNQNGVLVLLDGGGAFPLMSLPGNVETRPEIDPNAGSHLDLLEPGASGAPSAVAECAVKAGQASCATLCDLPAGATELRFAPNGDLWATVAPSVSTSQIPPGASRLFRVLAADRALAGQLSPTPTCPAVGLRYPLNGQPEGFSELGLVDKTLYLNGSRHSLFINLSSP